jgi:serine/threonine-protein kinase
LLSGLATAVVDTGGAHAARSLLREAQRRHPGDFWINYQLGQFSQSRQPQAAVGYFRAAVAVRPTNDQAYSMLGRALGDAGDVDGAIEAFDRAIELNPERAGARDLARVLASKGRLEDARRTWEAILRRDPPNHDTWYGYAQLCLFLGNEGEYRRTRAAMLRRFGDTDDWVVAERTSLASLLLPADADELHRAVALADRAAAAARKSDEPDNPYVQFLGGLAEYRRGRYEQAIPPLRASAAKLASRPGPGLVLAMAQYRSGAEDAARKTLATAVRNYPWTTRQADHPTVWLSHVLRREAEAMILPELPAFLRGQWRPGDNDQRLALLGVCQAQGRYAAAAQLYADAFAADPALADRLAEECVSRALGEGNPVNRAEVLSTDPRYLAARCAALAARDGADLTETERAQWRARARDWLEADLVAWGRVLRGDEEPRRRVARQMLMLWQSDPDLAAVRETGALSNLSDPEHEQWTAFWEKAEAVLERGRSGE